jgi:hypothetical protein
MGGLLEANEDLSLKLDGFGQRFDWKQMQMGPLVGICRAYKSINDRCRPRVPRCNGEYQAKALVFSFIAF